MPRRLLALMLVACGPSIPTDAASDTSDTTLASSGVDTTTGATTTGTPTTGLPVDGCPDHVAVDDCCCFGPIEGVPHVEVRCPTAQLCSTIQGECSGDFIDCDADNEVAVGCILAALQGDEPGFVAWDLQWVNADQPTLHVRVHVSGEGDLFWLGVEYTGDPVYLHGAQRYSVAALNLAACAAEPTASARFECLRGAFTDPSEICVEPNYSF